MIIEILCSFILLGLLWVVFLKGFFVYLKAVKAFGYKNVGYICVPFTSFKNYQANITQKYGNSYQTFFNIIRKNPETKVILYQTLFLNVLFLVDPDLIKDMSVEIVEKIYKPQGFLYKQLFFDGIFGLEGGEWKRSRKILSNLFHFQSLQKRQETTSNAIFKHTKNLQENKIDIFQLSRKIISESLIESLLGKRFIQITYNNQTFFEGIANLLNQTFDLTRESWHTFRSLALGLKVRYDSIHATKDQKKLYEKLTQFKNFTIKNLKQQQEKFKRGEEVAPFLANYFKMDPQGKLYDQVFMQINNLFFAGVDSTTTALTLCLYQLAEHQDIQKQLRNSIKQHLKSGEDIHTCKPLNNFIYETLRLNSPVPNLLVRLARQNIKSQNGLRISKNEIISAGMTMTMRNPKYFEDPDNFNPNRFNKPIEKVFSYIPFAAGPRNCIGQHMAMIMIRISLKEMLSKYQMNRTQAKFQMFTGGFELNRPVDNNLVKFSLLD